MVEQWINKVLLIWSLLRFSLKCILNIFSLFDSTTLQCFRLSLLYDDSFFICIIKSFLMTVSRLIFWGLLILTFLLNIYWSYFWLHFNIENISELLLLGSINILHFGCLMGRVTLNLAGPHILIHLSYFTCFGS